MNRPPFPVFPPCHNSAPMLPRSPFSQQRIIGDLHPYDHLTGLQDQETVPSSPEDPPFSLSEDLTCALTHLFPRSRGLELLSLLLQRGTHSSACEGLRQGSVALIRIESTESFARSQQGWSKDTVLRYLCVLEALQILQRTRHAGWTELHIFLDWAPSPHIRERLDHLLRPGGGRAKLQQLARSVKTRFLLLYGEAAGRQQGWFDELGHLLSTLSDLFQRPRLSVVQRRLLSQRLLQFKARLEAEGDVYRERSSLLRGRPVSPDAGQGDLRPMRDRRQKPLPSSQGDVSPHQEEAHTPSPGWRQSDSLSHLLTTREAQGDFRQRLARKGDLENLEQVSSLSAFPAQGDFRQRPPREERLPVAPQGDFEGQKANPLREKGDFFAQASFNENDTSRDKDITQKETVLVNDACERSPYTPREAGIVGRQLAMFLEESPRNTGGFVNAAKQYGHRVIRAAVIDLLVHRTFPSIDPDDHRGRPQNPGRWFHAACKTYSACTTLPTWIEKWHQSDLSWEEIGHQLDLFKQHYQRLLIEGSTHAALLRSFLSGEISQQQLDEALHTAASRSLTAPALQPSSPSSSRSEPRKSDRQEADQQNPPTWMDEAEAEALVDEILRDAGPLGVSEARVKAEYGVPIVELVWHGRPITMRTVQAWRTHFAKVQRALRIKEQYLGSRKSGKGTL